LIQVNDASARTIFIGEFSAVSKRPDMNHQHRKTLHALFAHPINSNIDFKKVVHLLEDAGAEVDNKAGNRIGVKLNGHSAAFTHAHHDLPKEELIQVRKFLESCEITPEKFPL
jgi:phage gp36-like protein